VTGTAADCEVGCARRRQAVVVPAGVGLLFDPIYPGAIPAEYCLFDRAVGRPQRGKPVLTPHVLRDLKAAKGLDLSLRRAKL
jgi:hypothetical protein